METISPTYGESVAIGGMALDASSSFSARLGRYPGQGKGSLGMHVHTPSLSYRGNVGDLGMGSLTGATPAQESQACFHVEGLAEATFEREGRPALLVGRVNAKSFLHEDPDPPPEPGHILVTLNAEFRAHHPCVEVRPGRIEVMGTVRATVTTPGGSLEFEMPGKWHEQVGERPRFGPRFIYLHVQGNGIGLLAIDRDTGAQGYAVEAGSVTMVHRFAIAPLGPDARQFTVELVDGRRIDGEARIVRMSSAPIEGQRRPGATVLVSCTLGQMAGQLNDWNPRD
jgi:hypothetical protein